MTRYQEKRKFLELKIKQTQNHIKAMMRDRNCNREELLELQFRLSNQKGKLQFIRPNTSRDISYREKQISRFAQSIQNILPASKHLVFHGTPIYNAVKIIQSGQIISGRDLWGFATSGDPAGQFSVTTKSNIRDTILGHSDLNAFIGFLPAGVIFVIHAKDEQEYTMAQRKGHIFNINFYNNPQRIHSLITTPENIDRVRMWLKQNQYRYPVFDYNDFITSTQKENMPSKISLTQKTIA